MLAEHFLDRREPLVTHVAGVPEVALLLDLATRQLHLLGVDHDDEIAAIDVRRERRLMLAPQNLCDTARKPAKRLGGCVYQPPAGPDGCGLQCVRLHAPHRPCFWPTRTLTEP